MLFALAAFSIPVNFLVELVKPDLKKLKGEGRWWNVTDDRYAIVVRFTAFGIGAFLAFALPHVGARISVINTLPTDIQPLVIGVAMAVGSNSWHRLGELFQKVQGYFDTGKELSA